MGDTAGEPIVFDDGPVPLFKEKDYIGVGKIYPTSNVPEFISQAKRKLLEIPQGFVDTYLPHPSLPVRQFVEALLPKKHTTDYLTIDAAQCFSSSKPNVHLKVLLSRPIPSNPDLQQLDNALGQAWFDGKKSLIDWRYAGDGTTPQDRYPFWVLLFWRRIADAKVKQTEWIQSVRWLTNQLGKTTHSDAIEALHAASKELDYLAWDAPNTFQHATSSAELAAFLGTKWLSSAHIDMMTKELAIQVANDPSRRNRFLVGSLVFANLVSVFSPDDPVPSQLLQKYAQKLAEGQYEWMLFPVHVRNNHWIVAGVNLQEQYITYGDSLAHVCRPPAQFMSSLRRWLKSLGGGVQFKIVDNGIMHGKQNDGVSCAICCQNTLRCKLFDLPKSELWTQPESVIHRAKLFTRFSQFETGSDDESAFISEPDPVSGEEFLDDDCLSQSEHQSSPLPADTAPSSRPKGTSMLKMAQTKILSFFQPPGKCSVSSSSPVHRSEAGTKRTRSKSVAERVSIDSPASKISAGPSKRSKRSSTVGKSRSATYEREQRAQLAAGTYEMKPSDLKKVDAWRATLKEKDPDVRFVDDNPRCAIHSLCKRQVTVKTIGSTGRWDEHLMTCKARPGAAKPVVGQWKLHPAAKTRPMTSLLSLKSSQIIKNSETRPCPGLTTKLYSRIPHYLSRTMVSGAGGVSQGVLHDQLFPEVSLWSDLTKDQQKTVYTAQRHSWTWRNDHESMCVYATTCQGMMKYDPISDPWKPCFACTSVGHSKKFQNALRREKPSKSTWKFTNRRLRSTALSEIYLKCEELYDIFENPDGKRSPYLRYALGVISGKYTNLAVFNGLVKGMVSQLERKERGKGMQNFKHSPEWDLVAQVIQIQSPSTAAVLRQHFPMRTQRSFRIKQSREPKFPMTISPETFERVKSHLELLGCLDKPVCLQVDDTKLFSQLRMYFDAKEDAYFLVGAAEGPVRVQNPEELERLLADKSIDPSTKMRLFIATVVDCPKIPPIVIAAVALPNQQADAQFLLKMSLTVLHGLYNHRIRVISYACDGTETERAVQRLLAQQADHDSTAYSIPSPVPGLPALEIPIISICGHPLALIQDSKHALKTFRNNLFSGARALVLGNETAIYQRVSDIAHEAGSPIYVRDVKKLDRQDDRAAKRLASADTLQYLADNHPEYIGEIVYLFVFGELVDAYQNRSILHEERVIMVLRARYFLDAWAAYLEEVGYSLSLYFLSREARDICRIVIEGYLALLYIYRDHLRPSDSLDETSENNLYPLLPWMHSTEACEHVFGEARKIVMDFTMLDFIYMIPKLSVRIRHAIVNRQLTSSDAKARASGYSHTYFDDAKLDIIALSTFPNDWQIYEASATASREADGLIKMLGINVAQLTRARVRRHGSHPPDTNPMPLVLPALKSWFPEGWMDGLDDDFFDDSVAVVHAQELQDLIDAEEAYVRDHMTPSRPRQVEEELERLTRAAIAISAEEMIEVYVKIQRFIDDNTLETEEQMLTAIRRLDFEHASHNLPPLRLDQETVGLGPLQQIDFAALIEARRRHQTREGATGVRTAKGVIHHGSSATNARQEIIKRFREILGEGEVQAGGTGLVRQSVHWRQSGNQSVNVSGNVANAAASAEANANKVCYLSLFWWLNIFSS
ncbi:hypothetical protein FISHEDRAFT_54055 [Fistulina hepatica ATCC 64428]|uniref:Ubiquitin-like protease family profile domain-containing protein n=1 Tax=Fistulina hepatica ATCC 64428 TaxID=1128425 RepID=A0A0D7A027_9AGAR|nr:hypothetical protein FISHEDRAFT_54055 [Fistulina hepatica ATCC 64428]